MAKFEFVVLGTLDHDQRRYEAGDTVVMTDGQAEPLVALGVVAAKPRREAGDEPEPPVDPAGKAKRAKDAKTDQPAPDDAKSAAEGSSKA